MKIKIAKYLNSIKSPQYNNLDKLFALYLSGEVKKIAI